MPKNRNTSFITRKSGFVTDLGGDEKLKDIQAQILTRFRGSRLETIGYEAEITLNFPQHASKIFLIYKMGAEDFEITDEAFILRPPHITIYYGSKWEETLIPALYVRPRNEKEDRNLQHGELAQLLLDRTDRTSEIEEFVKRISYTEGINVICGLQRSETWDKLFLNLDHNYRPRTADIHSPFADMQVVVSGGACNPR